MESRARLSQARVSPRKARLVADLIRGREVGEALEVLAVTRKKTAPLLKALVESAVANAEHSADEHDVKLDIDALFVKTVTVDPGPTTRRWRPRARGMATKVIKRTSHITVVLDEQRSLEEQGQEG